MSEQTEKRRMSLLTGALLFLTLVVYFNLRSPEPTTAVDWAVIVFGGLFVAFALVQRWRGKG